MKHYFMLAFIVACFVHMAQAQRIGQYEQEALVFIATEAEHLLTLVDGAKSEKRAKARAKTLTTLRDGLLQLKERAEQAQHASLVDQRFPFDYDALARDIQAIADGIYDALNTPSRTPRVLPTIEADY